MDLLKNFLKEKNISSIEFIQRSDLGISPEKEAIKYNVPLSNLIKSLVLKIDSDFFVFLVPMNMKLDFTELRSELNCRKIRMATPSEVKACTGYEVGCVPPFGFRNNLSTYIVSGFDENSMLLASGGCESSLMKISFQELQNIVTAID